MAIVLVAMTWAGAGCEETKKSQKSQETGGTPATLHKNPQKEVYAATFSKTKITAPQIAALSEHKNLREITFYECDEFANDALAELVKLAGVKSLHFTRCGIDDNNLKQLAAVPGVERLTLTNTNVTEKGIASLKSWKHLRGLTLSGALTDGALRGLASLDRLQSLEISVNEFDAKRLNEIPLPGMRELKLPNTQLTDVQIALLPTWPSLERFEFPANKITDRGAARLAEYATLKRLSLAESKVTHVGVRKLVALKGLERLNLFGCKGVSNEALKTIAKMPALKWVSVEYTTIDGKRLLEVASSKTLRNFEIGQKQTTKAETDRLAKAMPRCRVVRIQQLPD